MSANYMAKGGKTKLNIKIALAILLVTLGVGTLTSYLLLSWPALTSRLNNLFYDFWMTSRGERSTHSVPVIVDLDEKSLKKVGQLPWSRTVLADLLTTLLYDKVAAMGLNIWLTEADRSSLVAVDSELEKNFGINLDLSKLSPDILDNDRYFRDQTAGKPVVIGAYATFDKNGKMGDTLPAPVNLTSSDEEQKEILNGIDELSSLLSPLPLFSQVLPVGLLNVPLDTDGLVRSMPLLSRAGDKLYPGLALRTLMTALKEDGLGLKSSTDGSVKIQLGNLEIPIQSNGAFRPVYLGKSGSFPHYSAIDILEGRVGAKELEGKIVFIGSSTHTLNMLQSTPFDAAMPETEIHATIIDNILTGNSIRIPWYSEKLLITAIYFSTFIGTLSFCLFSLPVYVFIALFAFGIYIGSSWYFFQKGIFLSPAGPILAMILCAIIILPYRYWKEQTEKSKLKNAFRQYVSPEVVAKIVTEGEQLLKGEQKEATILFTDVRNFASFSENLSPTQLVRLLNYYFTPMTACVTARQGTLDKFIGDALMAFWNAPISIEEHSLKAVQAAIDMQNALARLRPSIRKDFGIDLRMGIGINSGLVHVGNMGSNDLMNYTCIGDNVNLASRLEGMCKYYGMDIVISASVKKSTESHMKYLQLDRIAVKGRKMPLEIYTPLNPDADNSKIYKLWNNALGAYFSGDFKSAYKVFDLAQKYAFLRTASMLFMERCRQMETSKTGEWDGVWRFTSK